MRRDTRSEKSDLYEFKMALFDNGKPDHFLFFVCSFNMIIEASGMLKAGMKVKYLRNLVSG